MELTARVIAEIPPGNLRVPRSEFIEVWAEAERVCDAPQVGQAYRWYAVGVAETCRWIAGAMVAFNFPGGTQTQPARAPISGRRTRAHEELIDTEALAADRLAATLSAVSTDRPERVHGVVVTLAWVWRGSDVPPFSVRHAQAG